MPRLNCQSSQVAETATVITHVTHSGPGVLFKTCVVIKFVDDDDIGLHSAVCGWLVLTQQSSILCGCSSCKLWRWVVKDVRPIWMSFSAVKHVIGCVQHRLLPRKLTMQYAELYQQWDTSHITASEPQCHTIEMHNSAITSTLFSELAAFTYLCTMVWSWPKKLTLTFDLWPWKPFQQLPLAWWILVWSFIKNPPVNREISHEANMC